jgi:hypothetical protein
MNMPSKYEIIRLFNKYAWGGVGNIPKFKIIKKIIFYIILL